MRNSQVSNPEEHINSEEKHTRRETLVRACITAPCVCVDAAGEPPASQGRSQYGAGKGCWREIQTESTSKPSFLVAK